MADEQTTAQQRGQEIGDTFADLSDQIAALVRAEIDRARDELTERAREAGKGAGYLVAAGVFGVAASGALLSLPALLLRRALPPEATAIAVGLLYGSLAVELARRALERLEEAAPAAVEEKIEEKKQDLGDALREQMPQRAG